MTLGGSHRNLQRTDLKCESKPKISMNDIPGVQVNSHPEYVCVFNVRIHLINIKMK